MPGSKTAQFGEPLQGKFDIWCHGNLSSGLGFCVQGPKRQMAVTDLNCIESAQRT